MSPKENQAIVGLNWGRQFLLAAGQELGRAIESIGNLDEKIMSREAVVNTALAAAKQEILRLAGDQHEHETQVTLAIIDGALIPWRVG